MRSLNLGLVLEQQENSGGGGRLSGEDIQQLLDEHFAVSYSLNGVDVLLKRLDMAYIAAGSVSPHADLVKHAVFKIFVQQVGTVLPSGVHLRQVDILQGETSRYLPVVQRAEYGNRFSPQCHVVQPCGLPAYLRKQPVKLRALVIDGCQC
jgi:hypothetical protein